MEESLRGSQAGHATSTPSSSVRVAHSHASSFSVQSSSQPPEPVINTPITYVPLGSRFISHVPSRPLAILPILSSTILLIGTQEGLFVLSPSNAEQGARPLIIGLAFKDLRVVGVEKGDQGGTRTPRGGIVALVSAMNDDEESGEVRVWQLGSLISLARFFITSEVRPASCSPTCAFSAEGRLSPCVS